MGHNLVTEAGIVQLSRVDCNFLFSCFSKGLCIMSYKEDSIMEGCRGWNPVV